MTIVLAALSVADVVYLNLRERAAEVATLRTSGWSDADLSRLVVTEAALLGAGGGLTGGVVGFGVGRGVLDLPTTPLLQAAAIATAGSVLVCVISAVVPLLSLSRLTAPTVLAEE
jgi:ABC-type antimicrobial peptide transport system permease subunit